MSQDHFARWCFFLFGLFIFSETVTAGEPLPRFTEEREAAACHFIKKHFPELMPLLDELKKNHRLVYETQIRQTFHVTEFLSDLQQDDPARYEIELKIWKTENKAMLLVAKLATTQEEHASVENQLHDLAKELVELEVQGMEHRVKVLDRELVNAKAVLGKTREDIERAVRQKYECLREKAKKKRNGQ